MTSSLYTLCGKLAVQPTWPACCTPKVFPYVHAHVCTKNQSILFKPRRKRPGEQHEEKVCCGNWAKSRPPLGKTTTRLLFVPQQRQSTLRLPQTSPFPGLEVLPATTQCFTGKNCDITESSPLYIYSCILHQTL